MDTENRSNPFRILFVCTGNTCRSPLAEVISRSEVARLGWKGLEIESAGVSAATGARASAGALRAASRHNLDLSSHMSRQLTLDHVGQADLILAMSPSHLGTVRDMGGSEKSILLSDFAEGGGEFGESRGRAIADPFGGGDAEYEDTFEELSELIPRVLARLAPLISP